MNIDQEVDSVYFSESIEEPLMVFLGEGSGEELKVGNEEKKKIFFFGQPGCLKHSPIRTNTPENHNNHSKPPDGASVTSVSTKLFPESENVKTPEKEVSDDDDNSDLLQRITEALNEGKNASPVIEKHERTHSNDVNTMTMEISSAKTTEPKDSSQVEVNEKSCINSESGDEVSLKLVEDVAKKVEHSKEVSFGSNGSNEQPLKEIVANESCKSENIELSKPSLDVKASAEIKISEYKSKSVQIILKSIVPYDDDSTSSSQAETEKDKEITAGNDTETETPQIEKSASECSATEEKLGDELEEEKDEPVETALDIIVKSPKVNPVDAETLKEESEIIEVPEKSMIMEDNAQEVPVIQEKTIDNLKPDPPSSTPENYCDTFEEQVIQSPKNNSELSDLTEKSQHEELIEVKENPSECQSQQVDEKPKFEVEPPHTLNKNISKTVEIEINLNSEDQRQISPVDVEGDETLVEKSEDDLSCKEKSTEPLMIEEESSVSEKVEPQVATQESHLESHVELSNNCEMKIPEIIDVKDSKSSTNKIVESEKQDEQIKSAIEDEKLQSSPGHESHSPATLLDEVVDTSKKADNSPIEGLIEGEPFKNDVSSILEANKEIHENLETKELNEPDEELPKHNSTCLETINVKLNVDESPEPTFSQNVNTEAQSSTSGEILNELTSEKVIEPSEILQTGTEQETNEETQSNKLDMPNDLIKQPKESSPIPDENSLEISSTKTLISAEKEEINEVDLKPQPDFETQTLEFDQQLEEEKEKDDLSEDDNSQKPFNEVLNVDSIENSHEENLPKTHDESIEILDKTDDVSDLRSQPNQTYEEPAASVEKEDISVSIRTSDNVVDLSAKSKLTYEELSCIEKENKITPNQTINDEENIDSPEDFTEYHDEVASDIDSEKDGDSVAVSAKEVEEPSQDTNVTEAEVPREEETEVPPEEEAEVPCKEEVAVPCKAEAVPCKEEAEETFEAPLELSLPVKMEENIKLPVTSVEANDTKLNTEPAAEPIEEVIPNDPFTEDIDKKVDTLQKPAKAAITRKRKISERKSISESDSDGNIAAESVSKDNSTDDEEVVMKKKPRMRGKTSIPRKTLPARKSTRNIDDIKKSEIEIIQTTDPTDLKDEKKASDAEQTLQNFKFDYDESEDIVAKVAAIKTMISKEPQKETASDKSEDEDSDQNVSNKRIVRTKRGRSGRKNDVESSSDEDSVKQSKRNDPKRSKTVDESKNQQTSPGKKKRETGPKGLLKYIDTSLVIETTENEAPVRMSRRIAQQKIREETERRQMEEKMLKQMKAEAEKKKKGGSDDDADPDADVDEDHKESSGDESFKGSPRKKKSKIKASDKQWQTSSSHSEHSESEDYLEHVPSDPGSPLFRSDHEFSPESDDDDTAQVQPLKRARTAKKTEAVASSDEDEDINPNHACQVCHKTDSPEWILLCDECDCGYHCSCLKPIIFLIPSGNWFCPLCCQKKLVTSLEEQLTQLDIMIHNIETAELRRQRQKLAEITEQNILQERRKNKRQTESREKSVESKKSSGSSESDESSEDAPLKDYFYKLRKRNEKAAPSYRFNEYDDLINHAISRGMDVKEDSKFAGNLGRGKDISTIIDAEDDNEPEKQEPSDTGKPTSEKEDGAESSGSDVIRPKKIAKGRKKTRKLNQLDVSSEEERVSDVDFKGTSSSDSEVDEEDLSMSSVSESSLDLPLNKSKGRNIRKSTRNREKRVDRRFINDNDSEDSDDEPLIKAKRTRKKNDSDEEEFDINDDEDDEGSLAEEIDSEDLCDDTETDDSSEGNWPKKKKKRVASYENKPRKAPKKNDDEDKAFRAGISKKKVLKKSDNESEASASESEKGKRKTRGKKLLYLIEDDLDSDESDGIKPGVKRPETPPEEREMFVKKQEEIKRMLAAKDTEAAKKLAAPTIEPIHFSLEKPKSPPPIPFSNEPASLSTIPKNVIESAKALDTDYNRIKPIPMGSQLRSNDGSLQSNDMNEEELARMMEEEDFAQHQLKLAGEAIARSKKLLELEAKEGEFAAYTKVNKEKEWGPPVESKKRSRKSKSSEKSNEDYPGFSKSLITSHVPSNQGAPPMPPLVSSNVLQLNKSHQHQMPSQPSIIANLIQQQSSFPPILTSMSNERPTVLSSFMSRPDMHPQLLKMHQPIPPEAFNQKIQHIPPEPYNLKNQQIPPEAYVSKNQQIPPEAYVSKSQQLPPEAYDLKHQPLISQHQLEESEEKKKGRRKKFTPLRTDLVEENLPKQAKLDPPSVIMATNPALSRSEDKNKAPRPDHPKLAVAAPPQIFNPATNPTPSVITRLLQPQQRAGPGPYPHGFHETGPPVGNPAPGPRPYHEDMKNASPSKARTAMQQPPMGSGMPQGSFGENPFVSRNIQVFRGPPGYGVIPPHARLPPYPFHLHPNLRPEYSAPYNMPPQFSYYAPPAHSRQPPQPSAIPLNHGASQLVAGNEDVANSIRNANNSEEPSETSEFGGLMNEDRQELCFLKELLTK